MIRLATPDRSRKVQMRVFGAICAISAIWLFAIYWADRSAWGHGKTDFYIVWYALGFSVLALGLLAARIWAELLFDLCLLCVSFGVMVSLLVDRQEAAQIFMDLSVIAILMTPVALTIYQLKRGVFFLRGK